MANSNTAKMARKKSTTRSKAKGKSKAKSKKKASSNYLSSFIKFVRSPEGRKVLGLSTIFLSIITLISIISHFWTGRLDQSVLDGGASAPSNWLGSLGAWLSDLLVAKAFGVMSILIPLYTGLLGFAILENNFYKILLKVLKFVFFGVVWGSAALYFLSVIFNGEGLIGGGFGATINESLFAMMGRIGAGLILVLTALIFIVLNFNTEFPVSKWLGRFKPEIEEGDAPLDPQEGKEEGDPKDKADQGEEETGEDGGEEKDPKDKEGEEGEFVISVRNAPPEEEKNSEEKSSIEGATTTTAPESATTPENKELELGESVDFELDPPPAKKKKEPKETNFELEIAGGNLDPVLPSPDQIPEIGGDAKAREEEGLSLAIEQPNNEADKELEIIEDNIQRTGDGEDKYEKIVPEKDEETLEGDEDLADWEDYDPKLELSDYQYPTIDLLDHRDGSKSREVNRGELEANKNKIVQTLQHYKIDIKSIKATIGPTVTLYEIVPAPGVRISKIRNLEDDIALSLAALGIRIIAPIPGKGTIGIEIPNSNPEIVGMRSVLATQKFRDTKAELPLALGRTISNEVYIADLSKMPHMLIAGATGQGKSVGINGVISSILFKKHPSQVKFVLIDPKKVELNLYDDLLDHFIAKLDNGKDAIITDTKQVISVLNSLCLEMDNRYDLLKKAKARNLREYNEKFIQRRLNPKKGHRFLPYIVLIIDEFADLMMTAGKEIETPVARLAQLARAIGIHLILATQRPSVNVITGIIKANFPARISYRVMSKIDSRTILDSGGADQLIGRGDMLLSTGGDLVRIQNAFIDTPEVEALVDFIGNQRGYPTPYYLPDVPTDDEEGGGKGDLSDLDDMFEEAARLIVKHQQGSTSLVQRRLKLGYNRAGRIIDQLETAGIVGPFSGSKAREVYVQDEFALEQILNSLR